MAKFDDTYFLEPCDSVAISINKAHSQISPKKYKHGVKLKLDMIKWGNTTT